MGGDGLEAALLVVARPLDRLRALVLRVSTRRAIRPFMAPLLRERARRISVLGVLGVMAAFVASIVCPRLLLLAGPLVLGAPHLVADLRYLVVDQGLHRHRAFLGLVGVPLVLTLWEPSLLLGAIAIGLVALAPGGRLLRRALVLALALGLAWACERWSEGSALVFVHLHNVVALGVLCAFARRRGHLARVIPVLVVFLVGSVLVLMMGESLAGATGALARDLADPAFGRAAWQLSPASLGSGGTGDEAATWAVRLVLFFVFAQSVHYAIWLRLVPDEARPRPGVRGFAASIRALRRDMGGIALGLAVAVGGALIVWWSIDAWAARDGYLRLALFHGPLELAVLAWLFVTRRPLTVGGGSPPARRGQT